MNLALKLISRIGDSWNEFWFAGRSLYRLGIFRAVLCSTMFFMYLSRHRDLGLFYTDQGLIPKNMALSVFPEFFRPYAVLAFWNDSQVFLVHGLFLIALLLLALGVGGRLLTLFAWLLHIAFLQRNYSIAFGADLIGGIFLFYLIFTQSCSEFSAWQWFKVKYLKKKPRVSLESDLLTSVFYRMIQIQLCVIYFYTGLEKLKGGTWWDGTALWSVFANPQMVIVDLTWFKNFPLVVVGLTFATVLFEVYFPALVWCKKTRIFMLIIGISFHMGIGVFMALYSFAFIMMAPYILFVSKRDIDDFKTFVLK